MPNTTAKPQAPPSGPGLFKRIIVDIETEAKHLILDIPEAELLLNEIGAATGSTAAKTAAALLALAEAAISAYEDASSVEVTPAEIAKLLPDETPLVPPAKASAAKPAPGSPE